MPSPNLPAPSVKFSAYERTTQAFFFDSVTANQAQVGSAAPTNANIYGMVGSVARGQLPYNLVVQVDVTGGTLAAGLTITLLGSIDGVNFYPLSGPSTPTLTGAILPFGGLLARYITAAIGGYSVASGTPAVSVSFAA